MKLLNIIKCLIRLNKVAIVSLTFYNKGKKKKEGYQTAHIFWLPAIIDNLDVMDDFGMNLYYISDKMKCYSNPKYRVNFIVKSLSKLGLDIDRIAEGLEGEDIEYMTYSVDYILNLINFKLSFLKRGDIPSEKSILETYYIKRIENDIRTSK